MRSAQLLVLALLVISFLQGFLCLIVARGERGSAALRLWGIGTLLYAFGLMITQQIYLPRPLTSFVGNTLITAAPMFSAIAVLTYSARQLNRRYLLVGFVVTVALLGANALVWNSPLINYNAPSVIAILSFVFAAVFLLQSPPDDAHSAAKLLAWSMLIIAFVWLLRVAFIMGAMGLSSKSDAADLIISLFAIAQIVAGIACTMALFWIEVRRMEASLTKVAFSDALTNLPNRRAITQRLGEELARARRESKAFSLLVMDLDFFKRINDTHGHLVGDGVLKHVANTLSHEKRAEDVLGRIGGEELVLLLPNTPHEQAANVAERLRASIAAHPFALANGAAIEITFSGGVAHFPQDGDNWDQLFAIADRRCYQAKEAGRNRVVNV
jgi:diguanylate cyclase (GGDEF)-like protein